MSETPTPITRKAPVPKTAPKPAVPTVGRIVLFRTYNGQRPAIITAVHDGEDRAVDLMVFGEESRSFKDSPFEASAETAGTWSWPPRS